MLGSPFNFKNVGNAVDDSAIKWLDRTACFRSAAPRLPARPARISRWNDPSDPTAMDDTSSSPSIGGPAPFCLPVCRYMDLSCNAVFTNPVRSSCFDLSTGQQATGCGCRWSVTSGNEIFHRRERPCPWESPTPGSLRYSRTVFGSFYAGCFVALSRPVNAGLDLHPTNGDTHRMLLKVAVDAFKQSLLDSADGRCYDHGRMGRTRNGRSVAFSSGTASFLLNRICLLRWNRSRLHSPTTWNERFYCHAQGLPLSIRLFLALNSTYNLKNVINFDVIPKYLFIFISSRVVDSLVS